MILGHAHPAGPASGRRTPRPRASRSARPARTRSPSPRRSSAGSRPVEQVRLVSSGTEATMSADPAGPRLHRPLPGREVRRLLPRPRRLPSRRRPVRGWRRSRCPTPPGCPRRWRPRRSCCRSTTSTAVEAAFAERGGEIAALITEASPGNMGVVPPAPGFTEGLRRITAAHGALLISDEVMTGFRCSEAGWFGLERRAGYAAGAPDLFTFGKVMGGGFPGRGLRRPRRRDGPARAGRAGLPGGHAVREPGGDRRGAGHPPAVHARPLRPARRGRRRPHRQGSTSTSARPGCRTSSSAPAACSASSSATARCATTTRPGPSTCRPSRRSSTRC